MTGDAPSAGSHDPAAGARGAGGSWIELSRSAARSFHGIPSVEERRELLAFEAAGSRYAIPVERVREIVRIATITRIPRTPAWLAGVVSLRGEIVQVVDLSCRLGSSTTERTRSSRIVVIHGEDAGVAGILVDSVSGVSRVAEQDILTADGREFRLVAEMLRVEDGFVGILDLGRVVGAGDEDNR